MPTRCTTGDASNHVHCYANGRMAGPRLACVWHHAMVAEAPSSAIARFERIFHELDQGGEQIEVAKMYGIICIKAGGKAISGLDLEGAMVFKLAPDDRE